MKKKMDRRTFNRGLGAAAFGTAFLGSAVRRTHAFADGPRVVRLGVLGTGWWGMLDLKAAFKAGGVEAVALCDVDREHLEKAATETAGLQGGVQPKTYADWREFLKHPGMEAVIIATPPHWHALPFIAALQRSLDVYLEKPVAYDIREGQAMVAAARRAGRIVQVGFQRRQSQAFRDAAAYLRDGSAGRLVQVDAQINYAANPPDATPRPRRPLSTGRPGAALPPSCPTPPTSATSPGASRRPMATGTSWTGASTGSTGSASPSAKACRRRCRPRAGSRVLKGRITTPDTLVAQFEFERCPLVWRHRIWGAAE